MKNIAVIGSGYVGLVTGTCLAEIGNKVILVDNDYEKVQKLKNGVSPIYEPGLQQMILDNSALNKMEFTNDVKSAIEKSEIIYIAVGTPSKIDGSVNLQYVFQVAEDIGNYLNDRKIVVTKSTVPVGTGELIERIIKERLEHRKVSHSFEICSNPEFLREGSAIYDFMHPDRIIIGVNNLNVAKVIRDLYISLIKEESDIVITSIKSAEMAKYASNAFLALKISYINEIANLCEEAGANVIDVAYAMGKDKRIGEKFLCAGPGYGGSCFPKDTSALVDMGKRNNSPMSLIEQAIKVNSNQKYKMFEKVNEKLGGVEAKKIAVLGITFKPKTDDMREAPSIVIINELIKKGANVKIFDPMGEKIEKQVFENINNEVTFCDDEYSAVESTDAVIILTEWDRFKDIDLDKIYENMRRKYFFDFRNMFDRGLIESKGFYYCGVGC